MLKNVEMLPPSSDTAVIVYPPGLLIFRFGKVAMPAAFVTAVLPVMVKLPLFVETMSVIVAPCRLLPPADPFRTVTTGVNCGFLLRLVLPGLTTHAMVDVYVTGPILLSPPTRPVPPPPSLNARVAAAFAVAGANYEASRFAADANSDEPPGVDTDVTGQKLSADTGGRMTPGSLACRWRMRPFGSVSVHTPTLISGEKVRPLGSVLSSKLSPAAVSFPSVGRSSRPP